MFNFIARNAGSTPTSRPMTNISASEAMLHQYHATLMPKCVSSRTEA